MDPEEFRMLGAALSPLSIFLFACEMSSVEDLYNKKLITDGGMSRRVTYYVLKLPASIVLPAVFLWYGIAVIALADVISVLNIVREQKMFMKHWKKERS